MSHAHEVTSENEQKTLIVILVTICTMVAEIMYGYITNSMALLADGYHMATHALALFLTYIAYILIRKFQNSELFPQGTDKIGTLAAYTSSLFLGLTGVWIVFEALHRIFKPLQIQFSEAIIVALIGLIVNGICILIMEGAHNHHHSACAHNHKHSEHNDKHHMEHEKAEHHLEKEDYNFKAAYYHILADALTSILAIIALLAGKYFNILCLDALIGILGGIMILRWSAGLLKNTVGILVDMKNN